MHGQEASSGDLTQALEIFFKLGLPDSRGAKWVQARLAEGFENDIALPGGNGVFTAGCVLLAQLNFRENAVRWRLRLQARGG